jgi:hypothetical protein
MSRSTLPKAILLSLLYPMFAVAQEKGDPIPVSREIALISVTTATVNSPDADLLRIRDVLAQGAARHGATLREPSQLVLNRDITATDIFRRIEMAQFHAPEATLFCYLKLHGQTLVVNKMPVHVMCLDRRDNDALLVREQVAQALRAHKARFTILLTDSCAINLEAVQPGQLPVEWGGFDDLILRPKGFLDVNSSSFRLNEMGEIEANEIAALHSDGGVFTNAFVTTLRNVPDEITWRKYFDVLSAATNAGYQTVRGDVLRRPDGLSQFELNIFRRQMQQTPQVFSWPDGQ